jgi:carbon starvation protein
MQQALGGQALMAFWYHFAIMFEALFILTAVDAGTRVARFMLQDSIGAWFPRFRDVSWRPGVWICTAIMVAGWGTILILGVTDPLGGINTFFPLFGIANQLLAAIALAVVMAIVAKRGRSYVKWLWIVAVPLAFTAVVTITASLYKIFSPVPAIGYWANHFKYRAALESGDDGLGTPEVIGAVMRNTAVQGTLSIIFVTLAIVVIIAAVVVTLKAIRAGGGEETEDAPVASRRFAPAGLIPSRAERELEKQWEPVLAEERKELAHRGH